MPYVEVHLGKHNNAHRKKLTLEENLCAEKQTVENPYQASKILLYMPYKFQRKRKLLIKNLKYDKS